MVIGMDLDNANVSGPQFEFPLPTDTVEKRQGYWL